MGREADETTDFRVLHRFEDETEGHVVAGFLRADGFDVIYQMNWLASVDLTYRHATGGSVLWVRADQFESAWSELRTRNPVDPAAARWWEHPQTLWAIPLALVSLIEPYLGFAIAKERHHPSPWRIAVIVAILGPPVLFGLYALLLH